MHTPLDAHLILRLDKVTMAFGGVVAVDDLTLKIQHGGIHALIGPNGAGKTTVFNLLTKYHVPTRGRIFYRDRDITQSSTSQIARLGVVRSFQLSAVFGNLTALQNVRCALQRFRKDCWSFWTSSSVLRELNGQAVELLALVGLERVAGRKVSELSYGQKRALELATTLAIAPDVLLLDEPLAGMGREDLERIVTLIKTISAGRTIVMVEHNLSAVAALSDRITVLSRGRILAEGAYSDISQNKDVIDVYLGRADG